MTHKTQAAARAAALLALGEDAKEGLDFVIKHEGAVWTFEMVTPVTDAAKGAQGERLQDDPEAKAMEAAADGVIAMAEKIGAAKQRAPRKPKAPKASKASAPKTPRAKAPAKAPKADGATKSDVILGMLKKPGGATSKEMEDATGWQPHSVRGFLGGLRKKGVKVLSKKPEGEPATIYSIAKESAAPASAPTQVGDVL